MIKKEYYEKINENLQRALTHFKVRDYKECYDYIQMIITIGLHSYDLDLLLAIFELRALICVYFDDLEHAIADFKCMRSVADDMENYHLKMLAYDSLGRCYAHFRMYSNALKCHKKQLTLAWKVNDAKEEMRSYEMIGRMYYYLGRLDKSKYYNDRSLRGKTEK